jgi:hypothetical protein
MRLLAFSVIFLLDDAACLLVRALQMTGETSALQRVVCEWRR